MNDALLNEGLDRAWRLGAVEAEVVRGREVNLLVDVANGAVETFASAESIGIGVRVFTSDRRLGFAYTTDIAGGVADVVEAAWQNALGSDADEHNVLHAFSDDLDVDWVEEDPTTVRAADKVAFARELEQLSLAADTRISQVEHARYSDVMYDIDIVNSVGMKRHFRGAYCTCSVIAVASEPGADGETGWEFDFARRFAELRPDSVATGCAQDATRLLGGKPLPTAPLPIVLDNYVAMQFLQVIGPSFLAGNVLKGKSMFASNRGEAVAAPCVTILDQNDLPTGLNRSPFDGEGALAQRKCVIDGGILKAFLHNAYTAHKMGEVTTANATRGGFRSTPELGPTNFFLDSGTLSQDDLFRKAGDGFFVTSAMGVHTADPISGDFSLGAAGQVIRDGKLGEPVRGVTIAGNIRNLLMGIAAVGNDLRFFGAYGSPSILVSELMVSGA